MSCWNFLFLSQLDFLQYMQCDIIGICIKMESRILQPTIYLQLKKKLSTRQQDLQYEVKDDLRAD